MRKMNVNMKLSMTMMMVTTMTTISRRQTLKKRTNQKAIASTTDYAASCWWLPLNTDILSGKLNYAESWALRPPYSHD